MVLGFLQALVGLVLLVLQVVLVGLEGLVLHLSHLCQVHQAYQVLQADQVVLLQVELVVEHPPLLLLAQMASASLHRMLLYKRG